MNGLLVAGVVALVAWWMHYRGEQRRPHRPDNDALTHWRY
jgi:hypothetical protein